MLGQGRYLVGLPSKAFALAENKDGV